MLTPYGQREWLTILLAGLAAMVVLAALGLWWWTLLPLAVLWPLLHFFRDPPRRIPTEPGLMVSPADGVVTSIHDVDRFEPLGGPAVCVRIFLSVLNVHLNRAPCDGVVTAITHRPGKFLNALFPQSAEQNESTLLVLSDAATGRPVAAVRQVAGAIARRIVCAAKVGDRLARGQRYGMIKFGSTAELYLPAGSQPQVLVRKGQKVYGGKTVLAKVAIASAAGAVAEAPVTAA